MTERTLILIKPDGVERGLIGEIISRIERKGLKITAMDLRVADKATAEKHYAEHVDKPFFGELVEFITSAPLVAGVVEGPRAIEAWRQLAAAPTLWQRRPPAPFAATLPLRLPPMLSMVPIPQSPPPARSQSGSRTCSVPTRRVFAAPPRGGFCFGCGH